MVTISDKRFGELVAKSIALDVYKDIANSQHEVIRKQLEASKLGMKRIKELEAEVEQLKKDVDYWHELFLDSRKVINDIKSVLDNEFP